MRPRLLDLFCGAGGAAMGYHRAGFDVVGVDIKPQPHYPFEFIRGDALQVLTMLRGGYLNYTFSKVSLRIDAIHASPPCQAYSTTRTLHSVAYPTLVAPIRDALRSSGLPYVIENVVGAPLHHPIRLCGSSFCLGVRRHRLFEMTHAPALVPSCAHHAQPEPIDVTGTGARRVGPRPDGKGGNSRKPRSLSEAREAMGIDWMTRHELSEAIPPAYTEFIGAALLSEVRKVFKEGGTDR